MSRFYFLSSAGTGTRKIAHLEGMEKDLKTSVKIVRETSTQIEKEAK